MSGQHYPANPIRIVAAQPGGSNDFAARIIAQGLASRLGQQVIVDNRPGGTIGAEAVLDAASDGYTLLSGDSQTWIEPLLQEASYDVVRDFAPIIMVINAPFYLYVHPSVATNSVSGLIDLAKANPGSLKYGSGGSGSSNHLAAELFKSMAGVDLARVACSGAGAAVNAVVAGEAQLLFASTAAVAPHLKSGRLKALAIASARRSALSPGLPAIAETLPGYATLQVYGMLAPAKTPATIVHRLSQEMAWVLNTAVMKERCLAAGMEAVGNSPDDFSVLIKTETEKWDRLIRDIGLCGK